MGIEKATNHHTFALMNLRKKTTFRATLLLAIPMLFACQAQAGLVDWIGGNGSWTNAANWSTGAVPTAGCTVNISNGSTVTSPTGSLPANLTINLSGNSFLDRPNNVIRFNNTTVNIGAGSGISGNGFWDLNNGDFVFDDGASASVANFELKGQNTFQFNLGPSGFTTLTPNTFRNDGNNSASPGTLISNDTFTVDMANYTGGPGIITLIDFVNDAEGIDNAAFQMANLQVLNPGAFTATLQWNDVAESIELLLIAPIPEPSSLILVTGSIVALVLRRRKRVQVCG